MRKLRIHNVTARLGDGWLGWPEQAPFPRILVTAAANEMPATLADQLDDGGIMIVPIGANVTDQTASACSPRTASTSGSGTCR